MENISLITMTNIIRVSAFLILYFTTPKGVSAQMNQYDLIENINLLLRAESLSLNQVASAFEIGISNFETNTSTTVITVYKYNFNDNPFVSTIELKVDNGTGKSHYISFTLKKTDSLKLEKHFGISNIEPINLEFIPELGQVTKSYNIDGSNISFSSDINSGEIYEITIVYQ